MKRMGFMEEMCLAAAVPFNLGNLITESCPTLGICVDVTGLGGLGFMDDNTTNFFSDSETKSMVDSTSVGDDTETELSAVMSSVPEKTTTTTTNTNTTTTVPIIDMTSENESNSIIAGNSVVHETEEEDDFLSVEGDCSLSVVSDCSSLCGDDLLAYEATSEILVPNICNVDVDTGCSPLGGESNVGDAITDSLALTIGIDEVIPAEGSTAKSSTVVLQLPPKEAFSTSAGRSVFEVDCVPLWGTHSICGRRPEMEDALTSVPRFMKIPLQLLIGDRVADKTTKCLSHLTTHFFGVYDGHGGSQVLSRCSLSSYIFVSCVCATWLRLCVCRLQIIAVIGFIPC